MARRRNSTRANYEIWPGFVDALTALLLVIIFLLVVFVLAQFFLSQALSGRDAALERLNQQVNELADLLALERQESAQLRDDLSGLNITLSQANEERDGALIQLDTLSARAQEAESERDQLTLLLRQQTEKTAEAESRLADAEKRIATSEETIAVNLAELESLRRDITQLRKVRDDLETEVGDLASRLQSRESDLAQMQSEKETLSTDLEATEQELGQIRDRSKELQDRLAGQEERTRLAQEELDKRDIRLAELQALYLQTQDALTDEEKISAEAQSQVALLNTQMLALRQQLARIEEALEISESKTAEQKAQIADLGRRLNQALAEKVQELQQYRSEFFGELRKVLRDRPGISIVGDRFVFQSEVLFGTGEAELGAEGRDSMATFASTLLEIAESIPPNVDWVLRVDGHTDKQPINTPRFPSNWELSMARALSVARYLISQGVPPERLAPTGFGEYQPLDARNDEIAYLRNRRIELKLTER